MFSFFLPFCHFAKLSFLDSHCCNCSKNSGFPAESEFGQKYLISTMEWLPAKWPVTKESTACVYVKLTNRTGSTNQQPGNNIEFVLSPNLIFFPSWVLYCFEGFSCRSSRICHTWNLTRQMPSFLIPYLESNFHKEKNK